MAMHSPKYVFREYEPPAFQIFTDDVGSEVIHSRCTGNQWDREFPLYGDDLEAMRCAEDIYCAVCGGIISLAKQEAGPARESAPTARLTTI